MRNITLLALISKLHISEVEDGTPNIVGTPFSENHLENTSLHFIELSPPTVERTGTLEGSGRLTSYLAQGLLISPIQIGRQGLKEYTKFWLNGLQISYKIAKKRTGSSKHELLGTIILTKGQSTRISVYPIEIFFLFNHFLTQTFWETFYNCWKVRYVSMLSIRGRWGIQW